LNYSNREFHLRVYDWLGHGEEVNTYSVAYLLCTILYIVDSLEAEGKEYCDGTGRSGKHDRYGDGKKDGYT